MSQVEPDFLVPEWRTPAGVRAAVTLRQGGVSRPPYDTLNLAAHTGDDPEAVRENRRRVRRALRLPAEPSWLVQEHGAQVANLDAISTTDRLLDDQYPHADGAVARLSGRICAIQVADCMPVLFAARDGTAVGAAHAGWRGLAAGVLEATVGLLRVAPANLLAWLGPAIGQDHFEVGEDVRTAFASQGPQTDSAFVRNARGRWQCDLYAIARTRLHGLGITEVFGGRWDTYADGGRFFSYRRDGACGRFAAFVWLEGRGNPS